MAPGLLVAGGRTRQRVAFRFMRSSFRGLGALALCAQLSKGPKVSMIYAGARDAQWQVGGRRRALVLVFLSATALLLLMGGCKDGEYGGKMLDEWVDMLSGKRWQDRRDGIKAIRRLGPEAQGAVGAVMRAASDEDAGVRGVVPQALVSMEVGGREVVATLVRLCRDEAPGVRERALEALWELKASGEDVMTCALHGTADVDVHVRRAATACLSGFARSSERAREVMMEMLGVQEALVRARACECIGGLGEAGGFALDALRVRLEDPDPHVRVAAAVGAWRVGGTSAEAYNVLMLMSRERDADVRIEALSGLGVMGTSAARGVGTVLALFRDEDSRIRSQAVRAVAGMGVVTAEVDRELANLLSREMGNTRSSRVPDDVAWAAAVLGCRSRRLRLLLRLQITAPETWARLWAAVSLWRLEGESDDLRGVLKAGMGDEDYGVRLQTLQAIGALGHLAREFGEKVGVLARDDNDPLVRAEARRLLLLIR